MDDGTSDKNFDWDLIIAKCGKTINSYLHPDHPDLDSASISESSDHSASPAPTTPQITLQAAAKSYIDRGYARCFNTPKDDKYTEAIADCSNALGLLKDAEAGYYAKRAYAYWLNSQYDRAIADCNRIIALPKTESTDALKIKDPNAFAHELLGNIYSRLKNLSEAIEHYKAAIKLNSSSPGLLDKYRETCTKFNNN